MKIRNTISILLLLTILLINFFVLNYSAFRLFNIRDNGSMLDACWRILCGQKPYIDFMFIFGPIHFYMNNFFFMLFGFSKTAMLIHIVTISSIIILLTYFMTRKHTPRGIALLVALLSCASFYVPRSFPWNGPSAHFWGIVAIFIIATNLSSLKISSYKLGISLISGIFVILSIMCKTNVGLAYGFFFLVFWILNARNLKDMLGYVSGIIFSTLIMFIIVRSPVRFIDQVFLTYGLSQSIRFLQFFTFHNWFPKSYFAVTLIVLCNVWTKRKQLSNLLTLFLGVSCVGLLALMTSNGGIANHELRGIIMALAFILLFENKKLLNAGKWRMHMHQISLILLILLTCTFAYRSFDIGISRRVWIFGKLKLGDYPLKAKPLRGWMFEKKDGECLDQMVEFIHDNIPESETMLMAGKHVILYALAQKDSYRGISYYMDDNDTYISNDKLVEEIHQNILNDPPDWIVSPKKPNDKNKSLFSFPKIHLPQDSDADYVPIKQFSLYTFYKRKK